MEISLGFYKTLGRTNAWKLKKTSYELKQSLRTGFMRFSNVMLAMKYKVKVTILCLLSIGLQRDW